MSSYKAFSKVYDKFMDDIPYKDWAIEMRDILLEQGIDSGIVAELGCGTGTLTELMAKLGFDMIGIDSSFDMLGVAMEKAANISEDILYLCQDIREFELYGTCAAIISRCDTLNYILEISELTECFKLVDNYLDPGGIFICDMNSIYKYEQVLGYRTIAESREDESFIWENDYDRLSKINRYELSLFIKEEEDLFRRYEETHIQRAYSIEEIKYALDEAGLKLIYILDADTKEIYKEDTQRYLIVAKEKKKKACKNERI